MLFVFHTISRHEELLDDTQFMYIFIHTNITNVNVSLFVTLSHQNYLIDYHETFYIYYDRHKKEYRIHIIKKCILKQYIILWILYKNMLNRAKSRLSL